MPDYSCSRGKEEVGAVWTHKTLHWPDQLLDRQCQEQDYSAGVLAHRGASRRWTDKAIRAKSNEEISTTDVGNSVAWNYGKEDSERMVEHLGARQAGNKEAKSGVCRGHQARMRRHRFCFRSVFWQANSGGAKMYIIPGVS